MIKTPGLSPALPLAGAKPNSGMIIMIIAMLLLPVVDSVVKMLTGVMNPMGLAMWRILGQGLFLIPVAFFLRHRLRGAMFSPVVALSGALLVTSASCLILAFSVMPIATAIAIFFVEPLILTLLAGPFLRDWAGPRRMTAVAVGLLGALIVIRPGYSEFGWVTVLPLLSATAYAMNMIVLKRATAIRSGLTVQCGATVYAAILLVLIVGAMHLNGAQDLVPPPGDLDTWGLIALTGLTSALTFVLVAEAYRSADATVLAPFQYLEIITATLLGFVIFGDFPDALTWVGIAVILGSGIYVFHRESQSDNPAPRRKRAGR